MYLSYYKYYSTDISFTKVALNQFNYENFDQQYIIVNNGLSCRFLYYYMEKILCMFHAIEEDDYTEHDFTTWFFYINGDKIKFLDEHGHYT